MTRIQQQHSNINWHPYHKLIRQQTNIGWKQICYGRFSNEWNIQQEKYWGKYNAKPTREHNQQYWVGGVIRAKMPFAHTRWTYRNAQLHPTRKTRQSEARAIALEQIKKIYIKEIELQQQDRFIFAKTVEQWETAHL
eukprot:7028703-Ditylum_brightwellii.AAC.1